MKDPAAPFDLLITDGRTGQVHRYQMKLGAKAAIDALDDARYVGGSILVPRDTLDSIYASLQYELTKAAGRGLPLELRWQSVRSAIATGRLTSTLPGGYPVQSRDYLTRSAEKFYRRIWSGLDLSATAARGAGLSHGLGNLRLANRATSIAERELANRALGAAIRVGGHAAAVTGVGFNLYRGVSDYERYQAGTIGSDELAARWTGRAALAAASGYAAVTGGPAGLIVGGIVMASELAYDRYDQWQDEQLQQSLNSMERVDRYEFVRATVFRDARQ